MPSVPLLDITPIFGPTHRPSSRLSPALNRIAPELFPCGVGKDRLSLDILLPADYYLLRRHVAGKHHFRDLTQIADADR